MEEGIATKRHRIHKSFCVFCAFLWLFLPSCSRPQARNTIQMAVGGQTQFIYLPLTVASQLGFFKDEGLNVNIIQVRASHLSMISHPTAVVGLIDQATLSIQGSLDASSQQTPVPATA